MPVLTEGLVTTARSGFDGSASFDRYKEITTYAWRQVTGEEGGTGGAVVLTGANTPRPSFTTEPLHYTDDELTYIFELVVTDQDNDVSEPDRVTYTVIPPLNAKPFAKGGSLYRKVSSGATVTLDGSESYDSDGHIVSYEWHRVTGLDGGTGGEVSLTGENTEVASFTAETLEIDDPDLTYVFYLRVTDNGGRTGIFTVVITVTAPNTAPVANAGQDRTVDSGAKVTLDGSASSDHEGDIATYTWTWATGDRAGTGNKVTLTGADTASPSFTAQTLTSNDADVTYVLDLVVTDDDGDSSDADSVTVTVSAPPNAAPVANSGPDQIIVAGATVTLDGSGSRDDDGRIVSYLWELNYSIPERTVTLSDPTAVNPTFTTDKLDIGVEPEWYSFNLTVTDDDGATGTSADEILVKVNPNRPPVADAGSDMTVASGAIVTLDGSASLDHDGEIATYRWQRATGNRWRNCSVRCEYGNPEFHGRYTCRG